ncbi:methionyl aminopeptidase [uncultured bacterium]|nr:methionyl aminopeptidase [uncultured bacterium]
MIYYKTKKDIDYIRESGRLVALTLELTSKYVKPGVTTKELDLIAEDFIRSKNGIPAFKGYRAGNSTPFPGTICASVDEEVVHGIPSGRVLKEGEIISIDVGVKMNGYYGDAAVTVAVGTISPAKKKLMEITEKSLYLGIAEAKEGNKLHDISAAVQEIVEANGFSVVRALCGHGVGKHLHEAPEVPNYGRRGTGLKIKNGLTIAIEPMVNEGVYEVDYGNDGWTIVTADGSPSAHYEHSIAIIDGKAEILTVP